MIFIKEKFKFLIVAILVFANFFLWHIVYVEESRSYLTVAFLDIGQGDAIFIEAPNGNQVLIDAGEGSQILRALSEVMPFYDRSIDLVIPTHPDADHMGGFIDVFNKYSIGLVLESGALNDTFIFKEYKRKIEEKGLSTLQAKRGMVAILDSDVYLVILFPDRDVSLLDPNDTSIVAKLIHKERAFMLTGDAPVWVEEYLVSVDGGRLKSDILKVGHHGSRTSTSPLFIEKVLPSYSIISAGKDNRYNHPHKEVLEVLLKANSKILNTAEQGTIIFRSDGQSLFLEI